jgi:hypothetical protein
MEVKSNPLHITDITLMEERMVGAAAIADFLECSQRHVRRLARREGVPIYKPPGDGRFVAFRSELIRWQRSKGPLSPLVSDKAA